MQHVIEEMRIVEEGDKAKLTLEPEPKSEPKPPSEATSKMDPEQADHPSPTSGVMPEHSSTISSTLTPSKQITLALPLDMDIA